MGEYDAVSASRRFTVLGKQIADLSQKRKGDREQLDQALKEVGLLRAEVERLSATVKSVLAGGKGKAPAAPRWDALDQVAEAAQLAQLRDWVDGVLRVQYPGYTLPSCWEAHQEALWELGTLHAEWLRTYAEPSGADLDRAEWFHERWLPGALGRLNKSITTDGYCRTHNGYGK